MVVSRVEVSRVVVVSCWRHTIIYINMFEIVKRASIFRNNHSTCRLYKTVLKKVNVQWQWDLSKLFFVEYPSNVGPSYLATVTRSNAWVKCSDLLAFFFLLILFSKFGTPSRTHSRSLYNLGLSPFLLIVVINGKTSYGWPTVKCVCHVTSFQPKVQHVTTYKFALGYDVFILALCGVYNLYQPYWSSAAYR